MSEGDIFSVRKVNWCVHFIFFRVFKVSVIVLFLCQKGNSLYSNDNDGTWWMSGIQTEGISFSAGDAMICGLLSLLLLLSRFGSRPVRIARTLAV